MMPYFSLSGEETIDNALRLAIDGGEGAYKLLKYFRKHHGHNTAKERILEDALSMYRGGHCDASKSEELKELLSQLNGGEMTERPFVFLGNNSDLSYFWYKDPRGEPTQLNLATVAAIPDEEVKKRTATTLARCYIDGLLEYDAATQTYTLSEKGAAHIYSGEFVQNRLLKEVAFFTKAEIALNEQAEEIAKRMEERGFSNHNRVTVDRHSLAAKEDIDGMFCRIPNTKGKDFIRFTTGTFFELTEKTIEVYIAPKEQYTVLDSIGNAKRTVTGAELSKFYEIKKPAQASEPQVQAVSIDGASYEAGDYVFALNVYEDGYELHQYHVEYAITDEPTGEIMYKLAPTTPGQAEIIQSERCTGITMFSGRQEGKAFLATEKGKAAADGIKAEFSKLSAAKSIKASPKFDLYTAAASVAYQSAEKIVRGIQK